MEQTNFQQETSPNKKGGCLKYGLIGFGVFVLIGFIATLGGNSNTNLQNSNSDSILVDSVETDDFSTVSQEESQLKTWNYSTDTDEMNESKSRFASLVSDNTVNFDFPYQGGSSLSLIVRYMKKYGTDVYIEISSGQFICNEYQGTNNVRVRFDDAAPINFSTNEPSDRRSDMLFLYTATKLI